MMMGGWDVLLVEAAPFLGAGVRTQWYGGHPYTFGPRHFLTQNERIYAFLNEYVPLRSCGDHEFKTYVESDQSFFNYPIHRDDIPHMKEADRIGDELGRKVVEGAAAARNFEEYW